jgi:hypothetical protein
VCSCSRIGSQFLEEIRKAVSDLGGGVRSRGEAASVPVVLGQGERLFPEAGPDLALHLPESRVDSKGVTIQVYRPAGRPQYPAA